MAKWLAPLSYSKDRETLNCTKSLKKNMIYYPLSNWNKIVASFKVTNDLILYGLIITNIYKYHNMGLGLELDEDKPHWSGQKFNPRFHVAKAMYADWITPMCKALGRRTPSRGMGKGDPFLLSKIHETIRREEGPQNWLFPRPENVMV
jgi:hypothetical protein